MIRLHTLPQIQCHLILWQHIEAAAEWLCGLKHKECTVGAWCILAIQVAPCGSTLTLMDTTNVFIMHTEACLHQQADY